MDYDPKNKSKFAHLTNNCVSQQYSPSPKTGKKGNRDPSNDSYNGGDDEEELDNIWSTDEFREYMNQEFKGKYDEGTDLFNDIIQP